MDKTETKTVEGVRRVAFYTGDDIVFLDQRLTHNQEQVISGEGVIQVEGVDSLSIDDPLQFQKICGYSEIKLKKPSTCIIRKFTTAGMDGKYYTQVNCQE
jgi:hypothetical protein